MAGITSQRWIASVAGDFGAGFFVAISCSCDENVTEHLGRVEKARHIKDFEGEVPGKGLEPSRPCEH